MKSVVRDITDARARNKDELDGGCGAYSLSCYYLVYYIALYRKIVSYVLLRSGLGSPTDIAIVREATGNDVIHHLHVFDYMYLYIVFGYTLYA